METVTFKNISDALQKLHSLDNKKYDLVYMTLHKDGSGVIKDGKDKVLSNSFKNPTEALKVINDLIASEQTTVVALNSEYDAQVTPDGVKVGCQLIPFSAVLQLAEVINNMDTESRVGKTIPFKDVRVGEYVIFDASSPVYKRTPNAFLSNGEISTQTLEFDNGHAAYCPHDDGFLVTIVEKPSK